MQQSFNYDPATVGAQDWANELAWLTRAVDVIGRKEVTFVLGITDTQLTDALKEQQRKDVKAKWFRVVLRMPGLPSEMREEYVRMINAQNGFKKPERIQPKTPEEARRQERAWLAQHAPAVLAMMDKETGE